MRLEPMDDSPTRHILKDADRFQRKANPNVDHSAIYQFLQSSVSSEQSTFRHAEVLCHIERELCRKLQGAPNQLPVGNSNTNGGPHLPNTNDKIIHLQKHINKNTLTVYEPTSNLIQTKSDSERTFNSNNYCRSSATNNTAITTPIHKQTSPISSTLVPNTTQPMNRSGSGANNYSGSPGPSPSDFVRGDSINSELPNCHENLLPALSAAKLTPDCLSSKDTTVGTSVTHLSESSLPMLPPSINRELFPDRNYTYTAHTHKYGRDVLELLDELPPRASPFGCNSLATIDFPYKPKRLEICTCGNSGTVNATSPITDSSENPLSSDDEVHLPSMLSDHHVSMTGEQLKIALKNFTPSAVGSQVHGPVGANVFVFHIPNEWRGKDLALQFAQYGPILSARIATDKVTGRRLGFGFVSYTNIADACGAVAKLNGLNVAGKRLKVTIKRGEQYILNFRAQRQFEKSCEANRKGQLGEQTEDTKLHKDLSGNTTMASAVATCEKCKEAVHEPPLDSSDWKCRKYASADVARELNLQHKIQEEGLKTHKRLWLIDQELNGVVGSSRKDSGSRYVEGVDPTPLVDLMQHTTESQVYINKMKARSQKAVAPRPSRGVDTNEDCYEDFPEGEVSSFYSGSAGSAEFDDEMLCLTRDRTPASPSLRSASGTETYPEIQREEQKVKVNEDLEKKAILTGTSLSSSSLAKPIALKEIVSTLAHLNIENESPKKETDDLWLTHLSALIWTVKGKLFITDLMKAAGIEDSIIKTFFAAVGQLKPGIIESNKDKTS